MSLNQLVTKTGDGLDINVNSLACLSLNGLTPSNGVYMLIGDGDEITLTTDEKSLFEGSTGVGSLVVPANILQISAYHFNLSGTFGSNSGDTITIRFTMGTASLTTVVQLTNAPNEFFEIESDFSVKAIGGPGTASITSNLEFTYSDAGANNFRGHRDVVENNTTFDTTINNTLDVSVEFSSTDSKNKIQLIQCILTRVF